MKTCCKTLRMPFACVLTFGATASAGVLTLSTPVGLGVPDANPSGLVSSANLSAPGYRITDVNVTLSLSGDRAAFGGWNGDLYAWLGHGGALSILLNRPGRSLGNDLGYADNGLDVVLDDEAPGDIHTYQLTWGGGSGPVTGGWQPDGRLIDPAVVLDTHVLERTASLGVFDGLDPDGEWTLFVADLHGGGRLILDSWALSVTVRPVPEPGAAGLLGGLASLGWIVLRRPTRRREPPPL